VVRRSPAERYLRFLIVRHESYSDKQIAEIARVKGLDPLGAYYIAQLRRKLVPPVPFYPENKTHKPSFRFLMAKELFSFYWPDQHMAVALRLLEQPRAKELLETMLLSESPVNWIVGALNREGFRASIKAVEQYRNAFFDVDSIDSLEMRTLMRLRFQASGTTNDPELARVEAAYEKEAWADARISAAQAPIKSLSTMMTAVRMGLLPDNASFSKVMATARFLGAARSIEAAMRNGHHDHERSVAFMSMTATANTILESVGSPEEDLQSKLASIQLQTDEGDVPLLDEISRGLHTEDIEMPGGPNADPELTGTTSDSKPGGGTGQTG